MKCAKVLYDKDISDKIMEINTLKNENRQLKKTVEILFLPIYCYVTIKNGILL